MRGIQLALAGQRHRAGGEGHAGRREPRRQGGRRARLRRGRHRRSSARCSATTPPRRAGGRRAAGSDPHPHPLGGHHRHWARTSSATCSPTRRRPRRWPTTRPNVLGYKRFAVLYPNIPYGVELANEFWDEVVERGGDGARRRELRPRPDDLHHRGEEAGGPLLPGGPRRLPRGRARACTTGDQDAFRRRKAIEKAEERRWSRWSTSRRFFIPDDWQRVSLVAPGARGRGHHHQRVRPAGPGAHPQDHRARRT